MLNLHWLLATRSIGVGVGGGGMTSWDRCSNRMRNHAVVQWVQSETVNLTDGQSGGSIIYQLRLT